MIASRRTVVWLIMLVIPGISAAASGGELVGTWEASRNLSPTISQTIRTPIHIVHEGKRIVIEVQGHRHYSEPGAVDVSFPFGSFRGTILEGSARGHWIQPRMKSNGTAYASPIEFKAVNTNSWLGEILPLEDRFTLYLTIAQQPDGTLSGFIRNPERNVGLFVQVSNIELTDSRVSVYSRFRGRGEEQLAFTGTYDSERDVLSFYLPFADASFDFRRAGRTSGYHARGHKPAPYAYEPPLSGADGWPTGTLKGAHISLEPLAKMIEKEVFPGIKDVHSYELHGVLIARNGKLVFEEYFHGFHRDRPHDTRSASKSMTATLYGAAIEQGLIDNVQLPVYQTVLGNVSGSRFDNDQRKQVMTVEHLLMQRSGLYCDDSDPGAPGNEENMQSQEEEPDWYKYTLNVPMVQHPGEAATYCSANSNLIGAVIASATGKPLERMFHELVARPLEMEQYHMNLQPTGEPYMGGGIYFLPRDFMKLGQLYLDDGKWNGERIIGSSWAKQATSALVEIGARHYGYQWWVQEFPYENRTVKAFYAAGNGGQLVMVVRELDLVVAFYGGNYSDPVLYRSQNVLFPEYILRAVAEGTQKPLNR